MEGMKIKQLTPKQEGFCRDYIETGNATEAYRRNYNCSNMKTESISRKAKELYDNVKITARLKELRAKLEDEFIISKKDLVEHLIKVKDEALIARIGANGDERIDYSSSIKAVTQVSKMLGYDAPTKIEQKTEISGLLAVLTAAQKLEDIN
jgi:phage terminase small subunit